MTSKLATSKPIAASLERPACPVCGAKMRISRIEPDPIWRGTAELRTFECGSCNAMQAVSFNPESDAELQAMVERMTGLSKSL